MDDHKHNDREWFPSMNFKDEKRHHGGQGGRHGEMNNGDGEYHVDKKILQERRITRLVTRASFVSFLMWFFIFVAAAVGLKAARQQSDSRWFMRCSFKKSIIFLVLASALGIAKLCMDHKIMKQMERFSKELEEPAGNFGKNHQKKGCGKNKFGKKDKGQWTFNELKHMSQREQSERIE